MSVHHTGSGPDRVIGVGPDVWLRASLRRSMEAHHGRVPPDRAPLNTECESDADPTATCESEVTEAPADWTSVDFDDGAWTPATVWSAAGVGPEDGYDEIGWDGAAALVRGADLEVDNTVLLRTTVG